MHYHNKIASPAAPRHITNPTLPQASINAHFAGAAALFSSTDKNRPDLHGIHITPVNMGGVLIHATDGTAAIEIYDPSGLANIPLHISLPPRIRQRLTSTYKKEGYKQLGRLLLSGVTCNVREKQPDQSPADHIENNIWVNDCEESAFPIDRVKRALHNRLTKHNGTKCEPPDNPYARKFQKAAALLGLSAPQFYKSREDAHYSAWIGYGVSIGNFVDIKASLQDDGTRTPPSLSHSLS
jgi:hypothetical protein